VIDVIRELQELDISVDVHDPAACRDEALQEYGVTLREPEVGVYDAVLLAVCHDEYRRWGEDRIRAFGGDGAIFFDLKSAFPRSPDTIRL
jgi:UDP-N-acetyl-D-galactosamine dehydrogenase